MVWDFTVSRPSQILPTNENSKSYMSRSSGMNGDKSGESGAFLFSRRVPDFCDRRRSFPTNENSNSYGRGRRRPPPMDFAHYQSPKLLGAIPPITNKRIVSRKSGQTSGEYPIYRQNLGWSAKSKIPDRLPIFPTYENQALVRHDLSTAFETGLKQITQAKPIKPRVLKSISTILVIETKMIVCFPVSYCFTPKFCNRFLEEREKQPPVFEEVILRGL